MRKHQTSKMRLKNKLINICIRHKCTKPKEDSPANPYKKFQTRIIRRIKENETTSSVKTADITSNSGSSNSHESSDITNETANKTDKSVFDVSNDVGMQMLHRSTVKLKSSQIQYDFINCHSKPMPNEILKTHQKVESPKSYQSLVTKSKKKKLNVADRSDCPENFKDEAFFLHSAKLDFSPKKSSINKAKAQNIDAKFLQKETEPKDEFERTSNGKTRFNELNMQMLSRNLYEQVFINCDAKNELSQEKIKLLKKELVESGMDINDVKNIPDVDIDLPAFEGKNIEEHFYNIAKNQTRDYLKIIHGILEKIPDVPEKWLKQEGWTR